MSKKNTIMEGTDGMFYHVFVDPYEALYIATVYDIPLHSFGYPSNAVRVDQLSTAAIRIVQ